MSVDLDELERLMGQSTKLPWQVDMENVANADDVVTMELTEHAWDTDGALAAAAVNALPDLLRELRALRAVADAARAWLVAPKVPRAYVECGDQQDALRAVLAAQYAVEPTIEGVSR